MINILIGTSNAGKLREIKSILKGLPLRFNTIRDLKYPLKIRENGRTFLENALKKAKVLAKVPEVQRRFNAVLVEDSGLEVDALGGQPGVRSARYAGEPINYQRNNQKLLTTLKGVPSRNRTARYRAVTVLSIASANINYFTEGICAGKIAFEPEGNKGFGYDPVFIPDGYRQTFAQLPPSLKNRLSHRARAIRQLMSLLKHLIK